MTTKTNKYNYKSIVIPASQLISPRETYQRELFSPPCKRNRKQVRRAYRQ